MVMTRTGPENVNGTAKRKSTGKWRANRGVGNFEILELRSNVE